MALQPRDSSRVLRTPRVSASKKNFGDVSYRLEDMLVLSRFLSVFFFFVRLLQDLGSSDVRIHHDLRGNLVWVGLLALIFHSKFNKCLIIQIRDS